ncbi:MAG: class I tRNA ligase family protein [bacterium]
MAEENKNTKSDAALREEKILEFWKENKIFEKSLEQSEGRKEFIFYEGPPTANGEPGTHHLEARAFKDAIPRYKTMQGFHVRRKGGWDTHGLPVELQVEKKLGLNSKKAIEEYGIAKFNQECKESVWEYLDVWNKFTKRIGYWVDQENPYVTYHNDYIESVWNIVKKINGQNLLYKDYKVVPWCPRCGTALSSHELAQGYEDVKDLSVYVKFKVKGQGNTYILAWTTTPWTLPGNVALAVGKDIDYVKVKSGKEIYILAKERLSIITEPYEIVEEIKDKDLIGLEYEPPFPYLKEQLEQKKEPIDKMFKIYPANFVNTEDGTGIVHTAVMYGQDDFEFGTKIGLPKHHLVNPEGKFVKNTGFLEGRFVKEKDENDKPTLDIDIIKYLTDKNLFFKKENYEHSYPHCWRCKTALIYYARDSWYIKVSDQKIKEKMIAENKEINWEPAHIRNGRFGEWLREIKDWAVSRERYWGTPLPVWICETCKKIEVLGSIEEIKNKTKKSGNKYFVMRHGEAENNIEFFFHINSQHNAILTETGKEQILKSINNFDKKIDVIISSPFLRAKQTTEIVAKQIDFPLKRIIYDKRIQEWEIGSDFEGKPKTETAQYYEHDYIYTPHRKFINGESFMQLVKRVGDFIYETDLKHKDKNILINCHGGVITALKFIINGFSFSDLKKQDPIKELRNAEIRKFDFIPLPHNTDYELDLHRPYIDEVNLICQCGSDLVRVKEVMDVWFDSGAMPFAQDYYPFENKKWIENMGYPADFICEAIDQTRGWFYTLHAIGILMGRGKAYKNVICLGHLLDAKGKKMSKSLGNIVDPWEAINKYGVDTLRLWMYSVNQPGESKNFDEKTVSLLHQQVFGLLYNVLAFYELYRDKNLEANNQPKSKNVLDVWILARLNGLIELMTKNLDNYRLLEPVRGMKDFIDDLSTWYLRRSRERIKEGNEEAKQTLYFVLKTLTKLIAPFAPLTAEDIWLKLRNENDLKSVHLESWPHLTPWLLSLIRRGVRERSCVVKNMENVRKIVTLGLEARQKAGIKVRQPLNKLKIKNYELGIEYTELIKNEINVKEIFSDNSITNEVELDINITPTLKAEGEYREFMRELQDKRKKMGLNPGDKMALSIETIYKKYKIMPNLQEHMLRTAAVASLICDNFNEPLPKEDLIAACLLHDMGNIIKFKLDLFPEFNKPEGIEHWQKVQNKYIEKYGENEHEANVKIIKELCLSSDIIRFIDQNRFSLICEHRDNSDINMKIVHYVDGRVDPYGIVSYEERMNEAENRYKSKNQTEENERQRLIQCGRELEKQIFSKCKIKPEDITNESVAPIISELRNFVIK